MARDMSNLPPGVSEHMLPGNEPECDHCGRGADAHHEEGREDSYGHDYDVWVCYPDGEASEAELTHFAKHGCIDLMPVDGACDGCGEKL